MNKPLYLGLSILEISNVWILVWLRKTKKMEKRRKEKLCYENYVMKNYDMFSLYTGKQIMFQKQKGTKKYYKNDYKSFSKIIKMFRSNSTWK